MGAWILIVMLLSGTSNKERADISSVQFQRFATTQACDQAQSHMKFLTGEDKNNMIVFCVPETLQRQ